MTDVPALPPPPLDHDAFVGARSLEELAARYAAEGIELQGEALLERALRDWHAVCVERARAVDEAPADLPPLEAACEGIRFLVYGVYHGLVGGHDAEYKAFVDRRVGTLEEVLFENGLHHFYPKREYRVIPDFVVLGLWGSLGIGLEVGKLFPLLLKEGLQDLLRRGGGGDEESFVFNTRYHALDPETRRGVDPQDPVLPSRLQIDHEMSRWERRGAWGRLRDPYAIAPRSLFMAGFAYGHARSRSLPTVCLLVGDLHAMEIKRFLEDARWREHPLFRAGEAFGRSGPGAYRLRFLVAKLLHLGLAAVAGVSVLLPVILALYVLVRWALGASPLG
ncbi:MAG: hypothetical protein D6731_08180 [Planctomycetota bacterium]|nr:MAG: hypothetical protein D6731_08180 [Planctomycetota bacterium]